MDKKTLSPYFKCASVAIQLVAALLFLVGCEKNPIEPVTPKVANAASATPGSALATIPSFIGLVKSQGPAVVSISSARKVTGRSALPGLPGIHGLTPDSPLFDLFRNFGLDDMPLHEYYSQSLGSGFIIDRDGYILTNAHVVADADEVTVGLTDKREFKAKLIGLDKRTDIAVLKVSAENLPVVNIGDPTKLEVGEWIVAIGTPFGFANSVTQGIVSAKGRALPNETLVPFIQTDAAINPGNSGGPLFNLNGEVVGINSQIYSQSGGYMGLSFAIPIDVAIKVKDQLLKHGSVRRGRLGIAIQDVSPELAESFGLGKATGALISSVEKAGPAERSGLKPGDIVMQIEGKDVANSAELARVVSELAPGTHVRLGVWRNSAAMELAVELGGAEAESVAGKAKSGMAEPDRLGLSLREMDSAEQRAKRLDGRIVVEAVEGIAAMSGIRPGDVILAINNQTVSSIEQLRSELAKSKKHVALLLQRDASVKIFISLALPEK